MKISYDGQTANINIPLIIAGILLFIAGCMAISGFYTVHSGERALVFRWGNIVSTETEGLHWRLPIAETVLPVDIKTQKATAPAEIGTKDLQKVTTQIALNYHLDPARLREIYTRTGLNVDEKIIDGRIQETVKAVGASYNAEQLLIERDHVKNAIIIALRADLAKYDIALEDLQIIDFKFSPTYSAAIEEKQTSLQLALKAKNDLERVKIEAEQTVAQAQAQAEAIKIQSAAVKEQGGADYVKLKAIERWSGVLPTTMMSEDVRAMLSLPTK